MSRNITFFDTTVTPLKSGDFDKIGNLTGRRSGKSIVLFYATWCGHCQTLKPAFQDFAGKAKGRYFIGGVDSEEKDLMSRVPLFSYPIKGYPTIVGFKNGKFVKIKDHEFKNGQWQRTTAPQTLEQFAVSL